MYTCRVTAVFTLEWPNQGKVFKRITSICPGDFKKNVVVGRPIEFRTANIFPDRDSIEKGFSSLRDNYLDLYHPIDNEFLSMLWFVENPVVTEITAIKPGGYYSVKLSPYTEDPDKHGIWNSEFAFANMGFLCTTLSDFDLPLPKPDAFGYLDENQMYLKDF